LTFGNQGKEPLTSALTVNPFAEPPLLVQPSVPLALPSPEPNHASLVYVRQVAYVWHHCIRNECRGFDRLDSEFLRYTEVKAE